MNLLNDFFFKLISIILKKFDKLSLKFFLLIPISFAIGYNIYIILINFFIKTNNIYSNPSQHTLYFIFYLCVAISILTFFLGVNIRIKYLKYIVNHLKDIENLKYLDPVTVKGHDELATIAKSINIMLKRLKENYDTEKKIEDTKNDLIVAVSHDIKTPLTSIIGYLELANKEHYQNSTIKNFIELAYNKSLNLKKIINELFEYTKLVSDYIKLHKVPQNIAILVNQIVGEYIPFFNSKNIKVSISTRTNNLTCEIDINKMTRVFENIIENANKYSYENTEFCIIIDHTDDKIRIAFNSFGNSMENHLEKIFEKMYRIDESRSSNIEGSGLGLAISKKIVELHNGKIWAECNGNQISFIIAL